MATATRTRARLQPTMAVGQPFVVPPPQQRIPEPVALVGLHTGQVHTVLGDNPNGPETMSVTPPAPTVATPGPSDIVLGRERSMLGGVSGVSPATPVSMAGGGSATIGGGYYNADWMNPDPTRNNPAYSQPAFGGTGAMPSFDNEYYRQLRQQQRENQWSQLGAAGGVLQARQATLPYQYGAVQARQATLPAQYAVLGARGATFAPRQAVTAAQYAVLGQQNQSLAAQRGYIGQQQQANTAEAADTQAVRAARYNVGDQNAVAQEALRRGVQNQDYARLGVAAPVNVNTAPGQEGSVAPWARATLQTQEDIASTRASSNAQDRANKLRAAGLGVQMQDTNVTAASNAARAAGLTLDEYNQRVDQASNAAGYAQLGATGAGYASELAQLGVTGAQDRASFADLQGRVTGQQLSDLSAPADTGLELYTDPNTGQRSWMTPAQADAAGLLQQHQARIAVDQATIPQAYDYQRNRQQYQTQRAPFSGLTDTDLVTVLRGDISKWADIENSFIAEGMTPYEAQVRVGRLLQQARGGSGSGGGSLFPPTGGATAAQTPASAPAAIPSSGSTPSGTPSWLTP